MTTTLNVEIPVEDLHGHLSSSRRLTVGNVLRKAARAHGGETALVGEDAYTYSELNRRVNRLATALQSRGIDYGDRLAIVSENRTEYAEILYAGAKTGTLVATQNWRLEEAELRHCLGVADPDVVFISSEHDEKREWIANADIDPLVVSFGDGGAALTYEKLLTEGTTDEPVPETSVTPEDGLAVLYTSGTTGLPKGAVISHRAFLARGQVSPFPHNGPDYVAWCPLFHMISVEPLFGTAIDGGTYHVIDGFRLEEILARHRAAEAPRMQLLPSTIEPVIEYAEDHEWNVDDYESVRYVGAMPDLVAPDKIARVTELFSAKFINSFGSTETGSPPVTGNAIPAGVEVDDENLSKVESPMCDVKLVDEAWNEVDQGEVGEMAVRGPTLFSGYLDSAEANAGDFDDGWFRMGDMFVRNEDGTLDFVDRRTYLIKTGGENVYPAEVEQALMSHPAVSETIVVRVPDDRWGEVPKAYVATYDGATCSGPDLLDHLDGRIARYKHPHYVEFVQKADFPRSTTGKIVRPAVESWPTDDDRRVRDP
ncbi:class I adenylate-forming enzyme family protein [Salinadaptatus halalkaliphilus]|nr:class I adenylate-forming enzyme family protein [Salinadaptatus halalkaliphilus]